MRKIINLLLIGLVGIFAFSACIDDQFDEPVFPFTDPDIAVNTTIRDIKGLLGSGCNTTIEDDLVFSAVVIANDSLGNFYKKIVVQDSTAGIEILIDGRNLYGKYPVGRRIFVKAKGLVLGSSKGVVQLAGLASDCSLIGILFKDLDSYIIGGSLNNFVTPKEMRICDYGEFDVSTLIKFTDVQFDGGDIGLTFADATSKTDKSRTLKDCSGNSFTVRTSGYAQFAADTLPSQKGSLICVLGIYKYDDQGYDCKYFQGVLRSVDDIKFEADRCGGSSGENRFNKDFEDENLNSGGWKNITVKGEAQWKASGYQDTKFGKVSNYIGGEKKESDTWLISPKTDLSSFTKPALNFINACNYDGANMEVYITSDFDGSSKPIASNWTKLGCNLSSGNWEWVNSGDISLSSFSGNEVYIAFRYLGGNGEGKTWEVDDIILKEEGDGPPPATVLFSDDFEGGDLSKWNIYSVSGDQKWLYSSKYGNPNSCAKMSGYDGGSRFANEDWLITPQIDLTGKSDAELKFDNATKYDGPAMQVYVSTDYSGTGDPNSATWTEITYDKSPGNWDWTTATVDLSSYADQKVYFGFKYTSTDSETSTWEIDNVSVK